MTQTATEAEKISAETKALVTAAAAKVVAGKISMADLLAVIKRVPVEVPQPEVPSVPEITDEQREALKRLPEVYGRVVPTEPRRLTETELASLAEERKVIDTVMAFIKDRKDTSIREVLANHFDSVWRTEHPDETPVYDAKGHIAAKQEHQIEGMGGVKAQRIVSGGKPNLTIQMIEKAHEEGRLDRKTYLKITKKPDLPRVLDEHAMAEAIKKDPALFFLIADIAKPTTPTTSIKVG